MTKPNLSSLETLREAKGTMEYAVDRYETAICKALSQGHSSRVVAEFAGMSHQGVLTIWKRSAR